MEIALNLYGKMVKKWLESFVKIAINGFGRIGRLVLRTLLLYYEEADVEVVAINDLVRADNLAYLLKYDSVHKTFNYTVFSEGDYIVIKNKNSFKKIKVFNEKDPSALPWKSLGVDYIVESTGLFITLEGASQHLSAGAKKVVITAPGKGGGIPVFVMGVNHEQYNYKQDHVVSNASCTTNCLAVLVKILLDYFGIEEGLMTTVHSLTASQSTVDSPSTKDFRGGRAAGMNIIPSSTGAAAAVALCLPAVEGRLTGMAFRVPTLDVSVVDLTVRLTKKTTYEEICHVMQKESVSSLKQYLGYCEDPVVSSDFVGSFYSCIFDKEAGIALNDRFFKLVAWYDNEMGYAHRVVDLIKYMATKK
jgi:glyceraldehyde 3-phosphate dehydrogenase